MSTFEVVDVQAVRADNAAIAVKRYTVKGKPRIVRCDVFIAGGGMGGVAAAIRAAQQNCTVCICEETDWIGGQMTQQGVSALDENYLVETCGATRLYQQLRTAIRDYYRNHANATAAAQSNELLNPGNCWVSRLSFEPQVAMEKLAELLQPYQAARRLRVFTRVKVVKLKIDRGRIRSALAVNLDTGRFVEFRARAFLDATELGDLLPLAHVPYTTGAEASRDTGEPHAPAQASPDNVQDFTYPFVLEYRPGTNNVIAKPAMYDEYMRAGKFSFLGYKMFANAPRPDSPQPYWPFWTYRRLIASENFSNGAFGNDLSMINWESNDVRGQNIIADKAQTQAERLALGKTISLGFLYWLQTEAPRDDGGKGYPELQLRPDVLGTEDGLSKYPYIRESRRIKALRTIVEQDIAAATNSGARARLFRDSVGIGLYPIDIHGHQDVAGAGQEAKPFQIPLGTLVQSQLRNFIPANKNIGTTHVTNGAFRLHPVEWAIGEAAGCLAALCIQRRTSPELVWRNRRKLRVLQHLLISGGAPVFWFNDVPVDHPNFAAVQFIAVTALLPAQEQSLSFEPGKPVLTAELEAIEKKTHIATARLAGSTRAQVAQYVYERLSRWQQTIGRF
jgi:hypothetical protein